MDGEQVTEKMRLIPIPFFLFSDLSNISSLLHHEDKDEVVIDFGSC